MYIDATVTITYTCYSFMTFTFTHPISDLAACVTMQRRNRSLVIFVKLHKYTRANVYLQQFIFTKTATYEKYVVYFFIPSTVLLCKLCVARMISYLLQYKAEKANNGHWQMSFVDNQLLASTCTRQNIMVIRLTG